MSQKNEFARQMEKAGMFKKDKDSEREIGSKYRSDVRKIDNGDSVDDRKEDDRSIFNRQSKTTTSVREEARIDAKIGNYFDSDINDRRDESSEDDKKAIQKRTVSQKDRETLQNELMVKKRQKSPAKPYNWSKLNDREKSDAFVNTYKHNLELKTKQNDLENELKRMNTQLERLKKDLRYNSRTHTTGESKGMDTFDHVEIENIRVENLRLKEKIEALTQVKNMIHQKKQATAQSKLMKAIKQQEQERNMASLSEEERKKLSDMLKTIDQYKIQLKNSEQEIKRLQEIVIKQDKGQQGMSEAQVRIRDLQSKQDTISSHYEANKNTLQNTQAQLKQLQITFQKEQLTNQDLKTEIDILRNELKNYEKLDDELTNVKAKNNSLEKQLQVLATDPLFRDFKDQSSNEIKYRETREENFKIKEEIRNLKDMNDNLNEKLRYLEKKNLEISDELSSKRAEVVQVKTEISILRKGTLAGDKMTDYQQSDFIDALGLVKWDGKDPKWRHLELTEKTRASEFCKRVGDNPNELKKKIEHLILEKGELSLHLERQATMLRTKIEIDKEKDRLHKVEIEQLNEQLKITKNKAEELAKLAEIKGYVGENSKIPRQIYERDNVKYDKNVMEFQTEDHAEEDLGPGENFFDMFVGQIDLNEDVCQRSSDIMLNMQNLMTFFTVDFYNHDTQHTTIVDGQSNSFNFQATYKVKADEFLITYLKEKYLKLELYYISQQNAVLLGTANVPLGQLISDNVSPTISAVIEQTVKVRSAKKGQTDQFVAALNIKYRMRYPINRNIEWATEKMKLNVQSIKEDQEKDMYKDYLRRKLVIKVDKATGGGFGHGDQLFVFFNFMGKDYITPTQIGPNPVWNYENVIDVLVDENFRSMAKNEGIKFIVFSDQVDNLHYNDDEYMEEDIIGNGTLSINNLVEGDVVYPTVKISGKTSKGIEEKGQLHVLVYWYEGWGDDYKPEYEHMLLARDWENRITRQIADCFRSKGLALATSYYVMNRDQDEHISQEDFYSTVRETLTLKISDEELNVYYHRLPKPFTKQNFESVFRNYLIDTSGYSEDILLTNELERRKQQIDKFNYQPTSVELKLKGLSIEDRRNYEKARIKICALLSKKLASKTVEQVFRDIDEDGNGQLSFYNLSTYLQYSGWSISKEEIQQILKIFDFNKDGNISLSEFKEFIYNSEGQNQGAINQRQIDHFIQHIKQKILYYLKSMNLSFRDLFKLIDNDRSGQISSVELMVFLLEKLQLKLKFEEIQIIIFHFDRNNDDHIDMFEFIDTLKVAAQSGTEKYDTLFSKEQSLVTSIESICIQLNNYMLTHNKTRGDLFDIFDADHSKYITENETKKAFTELNINVKPGEVKEFFDFLDTNNDKKIGIKEFIQTLRNELTRLEKNGKLKMPIENQEPSSMHQSERIQQRHNSIQSSFTQKPSGRESAQSLMLQSNDDLIVQKFRANVKRNKSQYETQLKRQSQGKDYVSVINFSKVVKDVSNNDFSDKEINHLLDKAVKQNGQGNVIIQSVLSLDQLPSRQSVVDNNEYITKQIFNRIARKLKEGGIDNKHAYARMDTNKNNSISIDEFKNAFKAMTLPLTDQEMEDMFHYIDKDGKNGITFNEFNDVMKKSQVF